LLVFGYPFQVLKFDLTDSNLDHIKICIYIYINVFVWVLPGTSKFILFVLFWFSFSILKNQSGLKEFQRINLIRIRLKILGFQISFLWLTFCIRNFHSGLVRTITAIKRASVFNISFLFLISVA